MNPLLNQLRVWLAWQVFGNSLARWGEALGICLFVIVTCRLIQGAVVKRFRRAVSASQSRVDDVLFDTFAQTKRFFFFAVGCLVSARILNLSDRTSHTVWLVTALLLLVQGGIWLHTAVKLGVGHWVARHAEDSGAHTVAAAIIFVGRLLIWSMVALSALAGAGVQVGAIVAGLGVGGVAAALAVQSLLGDLFASLSIYLDRPFNLGDFIIVGNDMGAVERIGLRSTLVRSLGGEQIVFSNTDLTRNRIRNYKRMEERRIVFGVGVEYATPPDTLEALPGVIRAEVEKQDGVRFDRAHFKAYGESSLTFEVVYYVLSPDFNRYMDIQQAINFGLYRRFAELGAVFAFPSRTLYLRQDAPLDIAVSK